MKTMKTVKTAIAIVSLLCAGVAGAETLDLNGTDRTVTDVADLADYDGVTNSAGGDPATLTFNLADGLVQTYGGVISGNILLVKQGGKSKLTLTGSNTYTGGTRIDGGVIVAGSATACGDVSKTVTVSTFNANSYVTGPWCALQIDVSGFANPISLPEGTTAPGWAGSTYISHSLCVTNNGVEIDSPITGGFFSFLATRTFGADVGAADMSLAGGGNGIVTFKGPITCTGMKVYMYGDVHFRGAVTNSLAGISGASWTTLPKYHFYSAANRFNGTRFGAQRGYVYAEADDVFDGLDAITFYADGNGCLYLQGHRATIGRTLCESATAAANADHQTVSGGTAAGKHALLSMRGGEDTVSNLRFTGNMTLEWNPTGDYAFTATSNRTSTLKGPVVVKGGTFELDGGHTMLNVTSIVVKAGATLKVASGTPFSSSVTIEAESGATLDLAGDMTAATVKVGDKYLAARDFSAGTYNGLTIAGAGALYVTSRPGGEGTYTWTGGGTDDNITTAANWQGGDAPDFDGESPFIVFAGGTAAVLNKDVVASGITFDGVTAFDLSADAGHVLSLGAGGISNAPAASASAVTVSASVMPLADQVWQMDTNVTFTLSGILRKYGTSTPQIIVRQSSKADPTITFIGAATAGEAGDFAGDIVFEETALAGNQYGTAYVRASGYEPFGPGGTLKLRGRGEGHAQASAREAMLFLSNAVISKAVQYGKYYSSYYCAEDNTTNTMNGAFTPYNNTSWGGSFPPLFKVGTNSVLRLCGDMSFVNRNTDTANVVLSSSASAVADRPTGKIVFDGRITTKPRILTLGNSIGLELNAADNVVSDLNLRHDDKATAVVRFGADYALSNGVARVTVPKDMYRPVDFDLCGTVQHIQGFTARSGSSKASTSRILSSGGPGTLRISQASDVEFDEYVATNVTIQMEGSATLTFTHDTAFRAGSTLALSNGTVAVSSVTALNEGVTLKFLGGNISIPSGQTAQVGEAFYLDEHGQLKQLPRGTYGPGSEKIGSFFAPGSGSIRVRKDGLKFILIVL